MSESSFDFSNITYANRNSKITLKTKEKLDSLAKQVAIWNQDSFYKKRDIISSNRIMSGNTGRSRLSIIGKSKRYGDSPMKNDLPLNKELANIETTPLGHVKKKAAFFESLFPQVDSIVKPLTPFINRINRNPLVPMQNFRNTFQDAGHKMHITNKSPEKPIPENFPNKENVPYVSNVDVFLSDYEESLPPPPTDLSNEYESYSSSITSEMNSEKGSSTTEVSDYSDVSKKVTIPEVLFDDFSNNMTLGRSMSITHDIEELLKGRLDSEIVTQESVENNGDHGGSTVKVRRSLSWSQNVHYIDPSSSEDECIARDTTTSSNQSDHTNSDFSTNIDQFIENKQEFLVDNDKNSFVKENYSPVKSYESSNQNDDSDYNFIINNDSYSLDSRDIIRKKDEKIAAKFVIECMNEVQKVLANPKYNLGEREHTNACVKLVKSCLTQKSVAERVYSMDNNFSVIEGFLEMQKVKLSIKAGFVLIDYDNLKSSNRVSDLRQLKKLYNVVLMVRSRGDEQIKSSLVYNIIPKSEADRLKLPHESLIWLEMYEYVKFNNLQPEFKFIFELYCMEVTPSKYNYTTEKNKNTPMKKFLRQCRFTEKTPSIESSSRSLFFTNIGSFSITGCGLRQMRQSQSTQFSVHGDCPFDGRVSFSTMFSMTLAEECYGRLNIYSDVAGTGNWSFYDCEITTTSILGWKTSSRESPDLVLPLIACLGLAQPCQYTVCAKENSFSVILDPSCKLHTIPCNRRKSTDGKNKKRFLAAADSEEECIKWCRSISQTREAFSRWTKELSLDA